MGAHHREPSNPLGASAIINDPRVKRELSEYRRRSREKIGFAPAPYLIDPEHLDQPYRPARFVVAIDSSPAEIELDKEYPSERFLVGQVAGVLIDLDQLQTRRGPFRNPGTLADAQRHALMHAVLPSSGMEPVSGAHPADDFRAKVHRQFADMQVNDASLLRVYMRVMAMDAPPDAPPLTVRLGGCPSDGCAAEEIDVPEAGTVCDRCGSVVYPTDRLRLHDEYDPYGSNETVAGRLLAAAEHLTLAAMLLWLYERNPAVLGHVAFMADGSLALRGPTAPLRTPMLKLWQHVCSELTAAGHDLPVFVGVEKSGHFVDHAKRIYKHIPAGWLMRLPREYIATHIRFKDTLFGRETYYGRSWLYHSSDGRIHAITVPPTAGVAYGRDDALDVGDYPTLLATCDLIDRIGTKLYKDGLLPVVLAHQYASVPLRAAETVLKLFFEENVPRAA
jgi:hypothetical protein